MANITVPRDLKRHDPSSELDDSVAAATKLIKGSIYGLDASGNAIKMESGVVATARGEVLVTVDNTSGAAGDLRVRGRAGQFELHVLAGDEPTKADIGKLVYASDNQTVGRTSGAGVRPVMGTLIRMTKAGKAVVQVGPTAPAPRKGVLVCFIPSLAAAGGPTFRVPIPDYLVVFTKLKSVINGALTTGDVVLTCKINTTAITTGAITVTQSGSAAGDQDEVVPTAANSSDGADDFFAVTLSGTQDAAVSGCVLAEYIYNA